MTAAAAETCYAEVVGHVVRGARELRRMDLATMATAVALSSSGWSRVETGETTMTLAHLRRAAHTLGLEPWELVQRADRLSSDLRTRGVVVHDDKPRNLGKLFAGGAAILAVLAGGAAIASATSATKAPPTDGRKKSK